MNPFYSALHSTLSDPAKGSPRRSDHAGWVAWLDGRQRAGDFRRAERIFMQVDNWLQGREQTSRNELLTYIQDRTPDIQVIRLQNHPDDDIGDELIESMLTLEEAESVMARHEGAYLTDSADGGGLYDVYSEAEAGVTLHAEHVLPDGANYQEILLCLPTIEIDPVPVDTSGWRVETLDRNEFSGQRTIEIYDADGTRLSQRSGFRGSDEDAIQSAAGRQALSAADSLERQLNYNSSHFGEKNIVAHLRMNERVDAAGKSILFIEEVQSDWHQQGRKSGYMARPADAAAYRTQVMAGANEQGLDERAVAQAVDRIINDPRERAATDNDLQIVASALSGTGIDPKDTGVRPLTSGRGAVPYGPFDGTEEWSLLAFKWATQYAAQNGFDGIAWTPGDAQAHRYGKGQSLHALSIRRDPDGFLTALHQGRPEFNPTSVELRDHEQLEQLLGKVGAKHVERTLSADGGATPDGEFIPIDTSKLVFGGDGLITFYDEFFSRSVDKWVKQFGAKSTQSTISADGVWSYQLANGEPANQAFDDRESVENFSDYVRPIETNEFTAPTVYLTESMKTEAAGPLPMYSFPEGSVKTPFASADDLQRALTSGPLGESIRALIDSGRLQLHRTTPVAAGVSEASAGLATPDGVMHLFADKLQTDTALPTLLHEAFHVASSGLKHDPAWQSVDRALHSLYDASARGTGKAHRFWQAAMRRVERADPSGTSLSRKERVNEFGAYAVEEQASAPRSIKKWVTSAKGAVKAWGLRQFGVQVGELTPAQLTAMTHHALKVMAKNPREIGPVTMQRAMASIPGYDHGDRDNPGRFHSALLRTLERAEGAPKYGTPYEWRTWLNGRQRAGEFRKSERDWVNLDNWLDIQDRITRGDILGFVAGQQLNITEKVLSPEIESPAEWATQRGYSAEWDDDENAYLVYDINGEPYHDWGGDLITADSAEDALQVVAERNDWNAISGSDSKYQQYAEPGGEEYRELLITIPEIVIPQREIRAGDNAWEMVEDGEVVGQDDDIDALRQRFNFPRQTPSSSPSAFETAHFKDTPNVLAHVRFDERVDEDGRNVLFIQELQSDWAQSGRESGFAPRAIDPEDVTLQFWPPRVPEGHDPTNYPGYWESFTTAPPSRMLGRHPGNMSAPEAFNEALYLAQNSEGTPISPFAKTADWVQLSMKRLATWAVDNGFDAIAWTTGEQQIERYKLSRLVDRIEWARGPGWGSKYEDFKVDVVLEDEDTPRQQYSRPEATYEELKGLIGKDAAKKIRDRAKTSPSGTLRESDLDVGGLGMRAFYDEMVPAIVSKWGKKYGAEIQDVSLTFEKDAPPTPVKSISITERLREAALEGMPMFSIPSPAKSANHFASANALRQHLLSSPLGLEVNALCDTGRLVIHRRAPLADAINPGAAAVTTPDGVMHLFADRLTPETALPTTLHEAFHAAPDALTGTRGWKRMYRRLEGLADKAQSGQGKLNRYWKAAQQRIERAVNAGDEIEGHRRVNEFGAYAIEEYERAPRSLRKWVSGTTGVVKAWCLRHFGLQVGALTPGQLRGMARFAMVEGGRTANPHLGAVHASVAYHGTPHKFDSFSLDAIGRGQGAQSFGWGLYFAQERAVAEFYQDQLSQKKSLTSLSDEFEAIAVNGVKLLDRFPVEVDRRFADLVMEGDIGAMANHARERAQHWKYLAADDSYPFQDYAEEKAGAWQGLIPDIIAGSVDTTLRSHLYQVRVPEVDQLLDWDAPLWRQTPAIQQALEANEGLLNAALDGLKVEDFMDPEAPDHRNTGEAFYKALTEALERTAPQRQATAADHRQEASRLLGQVGIPGLSYLDAMSRGNGGADTRNFVIWDERVITLEAVNDELAQQDALVRASQDGVAASIGDEAKQFDQATAELIESDPVHGRVKAWGATATSRADLDDLYTNTAPEGGELTLYAIDGIPCPPGSPQAKAAELVQSMGLVRARAFAQSLHRQAEAHGPWSGSKGLGWTKTVYDTTKAMAPETPVTAETVEYNTAPADDMFVEWDTPIAEQDTPARDALTRLCDELSLTANTLELTQALQRRDISGGELYSLLVEVLEIQGSSSAEAQESVSGFFAEQGIAGIRYSAAPAVDGATETSTAYRVFDKDVVKAAAFTGISRKDLNESLGPVHEQPAFQRWFGNSKVVNPDGSPKILYHGSPDARGIFGPEGRFATTGERHNGTDPDRAYFFTDSYTTAHSYSDASRAFDYQNALNCVLQMYVSLRHPLEIDAEGKNWSEMGGPGGQDALIRQAKDAGHDGIIIRNTHDSYQVTGPRSDIYVAFHPEQIKSAETKLVHDFYDGTPIPHSGPNLGGFDPSDPRIQYSISEDAPSTTERLQRGEAQGFDTGRVWYHGGFKRFEEFDPGRSGSGAFHLSASRDFAESYASTKSQDGELDLEPVVQEFYARGPLFDPSNQEHLSRLAKQLPAELTYRSFYGWAFMDPEITVSKSELLEDIQGVGFPYVGVSDEDIGAIRQGASRFTREGGQEVVRDYDPKTDIVTYTPLYRIQALNQKKATMEHFIRDRGEDYWEVKMLRLEIARMEKEIPKYHLDLSPEKRGGFDNWRVLESEEIRPYLIAAGFTGAIAQERRQETLVMFDADNLRRTDSPFPDRHNPQTPRYQQTGNGIFMAHRSGADLYVGKDEAGKVTLSAVTGDHPSQHSTVYHAFAEKLAKNSGLQGPFDQALKLATGHIEVDQKPETAMAGRRQPEQENGLQRSL